MELKNKLYIVPTPIGNIEDITYRAVKTLTNCDVIFCEDTRETANLLRELNIPHKELISSHDFNEETSKLNVISKLKENKSVCLVSDRGTPVISDPGYKVIKEVIDNGFEIEALPGATAFVPALLLSGIEPSPFLFYGFLNNKKGKRINELETLKNYPFTIIFYESPNRINDTIKDIKSVFSTRNVSVSREITKMYEETYRFNTDDFNEEVIKTKGEFVIVVSGNYNDEYENIDIFEHIDLLLRQGLSEKDAIKKVASDRKINKSSIYNEFQRRK